MHNESIIPFRVLVVGGVGAMGRHAVRTIVRLGTTSSIIIADIDGDRASKFAQEIGDLAKPLQLDVRDESAMRAAFSECDVVLNTMGPFAQFGRPILLAALESGCDYLDIDDDWDATVEALELNDLAAQQGCRAVIGVGASPGTTNLCAVLATEALDSVDELYTGWTLEMASNVPESEYPTTGRVSAAAKHWLLQCTGLIRTWDGNEPVHAKPLERVDFEFPGIGSVHAYTMGHPEPITLPHSFSGVNRVLNLQSTVSPDLFDHFRDIAAQYENGIVSLDDGARLLAEGPRTDSGRQNIPLPPVYAVARGMLAGEPTSVAVHPRLELPGGLGGNTGIPLAIGLELLRRGMVSGFGVFPPEKAIDPTQYFEIYGKILGLASTAIEDVLEIKYSTSSRVS